MGHLSSDTCTSSWNAIFAHGVCLLPGTVGQIAQWNNSVSAVQVDNSRTFPKKNTEPNRNGEAKKKSRREREREGSAEETHKQSTR